MIVVDTSVWINRLNGVSTPSVEALKTIADPRQVLVGDIVLLEVLQGSRHEEAAQRIETLLRRFAVRAMLGQSIALKAAGNYRQLRRKGLTIRSSIDVVIATYCIEHGHQLLQDDRDFKPMAEHLGLQLA